jgi:hypothetical protein
LSAALLTLWSRFEVIEHISAWPEFLLEARRVLADGGLFLASTPNKAFYSETREQSGPNPYHQHEFEYGEFHQALAAVFPYVTVVLENHSECVLFEAPDPTSGQAHIEQPSSPLEANYYLAICSTRPVTAASFVYVPRAANILKERTEHIRRLEAELKTKNDWLMQAQSEHAHLVTLHDHQTRELQASNTWAAELNDKLNRTANRVVALQEELHQQQHGYEAQIQEVQRALEERTQWARSLETRVTEVAADLARCVALLDEAEARVVERTHWAQDLDRQLEALRAIVAAVRSSRWVKLGRTIHVGPELPS